MKKQTHRLAQRRKVFQLNKAAYQELEKELDTLEKRSVQTKPQENTKS